jgi:S1-C subfamily serine protease
MMETNPMSHNAKMQSEKRPSRVFLQRLFVSLTIMMFFVVFVPSLSAQSLDDTRSLDRITRATVFIRQARSSNLTTACVGSGTIVRYDGLILTNAHHVVTSEDCPGDTIIIALSLEPGQPPVPRYRAEIVQVDEGLDLALLRITREFDGRLIDPSSLPVLPFVDLADATETDLDETLTLVGYPAPSSEAASVIPSSVKGFIDEPSLGTRAWIKIGTVSAAPGTISGGGAYNRAGQLIGVATTAPAGRTGRTDCQVLEDTNSDGFINNSDACVPIGDFISVLRPVDFARPLIRSASLGLSVSKLTTPSTQASVTGEPRFSRLFFAPTVVEDLPSTVIGSAPAGINSLYLFFDYENMTPETVYELRVTIDGVPQKDFDLPPVRWSGGQRGLWYIGAAGLPYSNGQYEFRLFINGVFAASNSILVGGPAQSKPTFSNLIFGVLDNNVDSDVLEKDRDLQGNGYVLPVGPIATGRFIFQNVPPNTPWTGIWSFNGQTVRRFDDVWKEGESGKYPTNMQPDGGLIPGFYRLDLYLNGQLSVTGDFVVAGDNTGVVLPTMFKNLRFLRANTPEEIAQTKPANSYPDGAPTLYLLFDWSNIAPGTSWTMRWRVDNDIFYEDTQLWSAAKDGVDFTTRLTAPGTLPDGTYKVEMLINNIVLASADVSIGIGQMKIDQLAQPGGASLRGEIIDGETGNGIPGVTFVLISDQFSVSDFTWNQDQVYALAITDRNGRFEIDRPLQVGAPYSVIIAAQGYLPVSADGFEVKPEDASPIEMSIPLVRD